MGVTNFNRVQIGYRIGGNNKPPGHNKHPCKTYQINQNLANSNSAIYATIGDWKICLIDVQYTFWVFFLILYSHKMYLKCTENWHLQV